MASTSFFIGLVSYEKSSFVQSQGPSGMTAEMQTALVAQSVVCQSWVNTGNLFGDDSYALTPLMARSLVREEIRLESEWFRFLQRKDRLSHYLRIAGRYGRYFLDWKRNSLSGELRRLLNIEYSHVDLYRRAIASESDWAIILEDDASATDISDLVAGLLGLCEADSGVKMINLSESFTLDQIGVRALLRPANARPWQGSATRSVLASGRPATNTVCAIAFRTDFLSQILAVFDSQPPEPVVPIDWKLNTALMRLWESGAIGPNECLFVEPAPIIQLSMVQDRLGN